MDFRFFELRVSPRETPGSYVLFAVSSHHGDGEAISTFAPAAPPVETLSSLLNRPRTLEELHTLGTTLFENIFAGDVGRIFRNALNEVLSVDGLILRIVLRIEPPELAVLPWEVLVEPENRFFLAAAPKTSLCRTLTLGGAVRSMELPPKPRALLVVPDSGLDASLERSETEKLLGQVMEVETISGKVTRARLRAALHEKEYHLVHFSGHGLFRAGESLIFLDHESEGPDRVPASAFADFFLHYPSIRLILLNSCQGAVQSYSALAGMVPELLQRGVPAVIAMQSSIKNSEAIQLASSFYLTLVRGPESGNVDIALARARGALLQDRIRFQLTSPIFASPVLYLRSQESQLWSRRTSDLSEMFAAIRRHAERVRESLDPLTLRRISRSEVQEKYLPFLRKSIKDRKSRILAVLGAAGYGKSTILGEIFDVLQTEGIPWILLVDCGELSLKAGEDLDVALGRAAGSRGEPVTQIASDLTRSRGAGVLMIDTLDLVLHPDLVSAFRRVLSELGEAEVTVVFTCRDHDYDIVLGPQDRLKQVTNRIERSQVPPFRREEIEEAAQVFVDWKVGQAGSLAGRIFAQKILDLSADSRPLRQITESPLLLAMLCDLFSEEMEVPRDLTVSQLYERYWKEKVESSRILGAATPELVQKPRLCLEIAGKLFQRSGESLQESVPEADLDLEVPGRAGARADLLSEGVLKLQLLGTLRFFHQTFLEFILAQWLKTEAGALARARMLDSLERQQEQEVPLYWWPVVRQLLVMAQAREFVEILRHLVLESPAAFRTVSLAAAVRSDIPLLRDLLRRALPLGAEHQGYLCFAMESAPALDPDLALEIVLGILEQGEKKGALAAVHTAVALLRAAGSNLETRLRSLLDAIDARFRRNGNRDEKTEIQGQLFQDCLPFLKERGAGEPEVFNLLEERYLSFTEKIRHEVVRFFSGASLPDERKIRFLETLLGHPSNSEVSEEVVGLLFLRLRAEGAGDEECPEEMMEVLQAPVPKAWEGFHASAVGRLYGRNPEFLTALLQDLLSLNPQVRYPEEVLRGADPDLLCQTLLSTSPESLSHESLRELAKVVREVSAQGSETSRQAVAEWLEPLLKRWPEETVSLYSAVADASESAWQLLATTLDALMAEGKTKVLRKAVLAVHPSAVHRLAPQIERFAEVDSARTLYKKMLVDLFAGSTQNPEAVLRLRDLSLDKEREIAVMAAHSLVQAAIRGEHPSISELLPLLDSLVPRVRESFFDVALSIQEHKAEEISIETLRRLAKTAGQDSSPAVVQRFCKLLQEEIRRGAELPLEVVEAVTALSEDLKGERGLGNQVARALIRVYKLMAQREVPAWEPLLERAMFRLLEQIDTNLLSQGETEAINLISALVRVDREVLDRLVEHGPHLKPRNVRPLAIAIRRTEGKASPLLARILAAPWCPPDTRKLILELQGV